MVELPQPFPNAPLAGEPRSAPAAPGGDSLGGPTTGEVGGSRHYSGVGLGVLTSWKCPACAQENTGKLEAGCSHCGSGSQPARHIGVPLRADLSISQSEKPLSQQHAFLAWATDQVPDIPAGSKLFLLLYSAWKAGATWEAGARWREETDVYNAPVVLDQAAPSVATVPVPRSLVNRILDILDTTYDLPDEQQSDELRSLIAQLKELTE